MASWTEARKAGDPPEVGAAGDDSATKAQNPTARDGVAPRRRGKAPCASEETAAARRIGVAALGPGQPLGQALAIDCEVDASRLTDEAWRRPTREEMLQDAARDIDKHAAIDARAPNAGRLRPAPLGETPAAPGLPARRRLYPALDTGGRAVSFQSRNARSQTGDSAPILRGGIFAGRALSLGGGLP